MAVRRRAKSLKPEKSARKAPRKAKSSAEKVRAHRARLRKAGLRPVQIWVPDVRSPEFAAEARRQSLLIAQSPFEAEDQAFVERDFGVERRMKRGEVWTAAGEPDYAGKPRPVVVLQDDRFEHTASITVCPLTTNSPDVPFARPMVAPNERNGLRMPCWLMADKISTMPRTKLRTRVGRLDDADLGSLNRAVFVFLGLGEV